jgi:hypothetical protein
MPDINPFSVLKMGNDPSLTQRTVQGSKALADLQRGMALTNMQGQNQLANTRELGRTQLANTLLGFGIDSRGDDVATKLEKVFKSQNFARNAPARKDIAYIGGGIPPNLPNPTPASIADPDSPVKIGKPIPESQAAAGNPGRFTLSEKDEEEVQIFEIPDPNSPTGFREVPLPRTRKTKRTQKQEAQAKAINIFEATTEVLAASGLKRGVLNGKVVIFQDLGNGQSKIIARQ